MKLVKSHILFSCTDNGLFYYTFSLYSWPTRQMSQFPNLKLGVHLRAGSERHNCYYYEVKAPYL